MLSGRRCAPFKILPVASRGETKHASSASYHARQSLELRDLPVTLLTEQKKAGDTISGLLVALSWKRPPDSARSMLPLSQNSDSSHVSCTWTNCYVKSSI